MRDMHNMRTVGTCVSMTRLVLEAVRASGDLVGDFDRLRTALGSMVDWKTGAAWQQQQQQPGPGGQDVHA